MFSAPLTPLLVMAGLEAVLGGTVLGLAVFAERPSFQRQSTWQPLATLWGGILAVEGVGQLLFWMWSADIDGDGPPLPYPALFIALAALVVVPVGYGVWRTRQLHRTARRAPSRPAV